MININLISSFLNNKLIFSFKELLIILLVIKPFTHSLLKNIIFSFFFIYFLLIKKLISFELPITNTFSLFFKIFCTNLKIRFKKKETSFRLIIV